MSILHKFHQMHKKPKKLK
uniref:Uncharacterized protein n=1 Tax=Arundo donax TaxID=35708 RepID=A0A0A8ZDN0_ARUDO